MTRVDADLGRHYTPAPLARDLVRRVLGPLLGGGPVASLRVLDPSCGGGALLVEACRFLSEQGGLTRSEAADCLVGIDLDPSGLALADRSLRAFAGRGCELLSGDALLLDWRERRFDALVGNPPWISWSGRHARKLDPALRQRYAARYETFAGWPSLHGLFCELAANLTRKRFGLLLPAQVCDLSGYGPTRALLRSRGCVEEPCIDLGEEHFEEVTQPACMLVFERREAGTPGGAEPFALGGGDAEFVARMRLYPRPAPGWFGDIGVHTGNCASKLLGSGGAPIREGRQVHAYRLDPPSRTIDTGAERAKGEYWRCGPWERYAAVPILLRQTAARPIAALHTEPAYFRNSVLACHGAPGVPHSLVVAWLNSSVVARYHAAAVREAGQRTFPQVKLRHLRDLPVPDWDRAGAELRDLAARTCVSPTTDSIARLDRLVEEWFRSG